MLLKRQLKTIYIYIYIYTHIHTHAYCLSEEVLVVARAALAQVEEERGPLRARPRDTLELALNHAELY